MSERILGASLDELRATRTSVKWRYHGADVLPVWVAEMDARPCPEVVDHVTAALARGDTGYGWGPPFVEAFAQFARDRWAWSPEVSHTCVVPDVMVGIAELIHALTEPGDPIIISPPVYDSFFGFIESTRRRLVTAPLTRSGRLDPESLESAFVSAGRDSIYLLCSPHNPTGTVHTADELRMVATLADRHGVIVIADEIHGPLAHVGTRFVPYLSLEEAGRGITVTSGSKSWNLAGLRAALAIPGAESRHLVGRLHEVVRHGANHLAIIGQTAAFSHGVPWLDRVRDELEDNRALLVRELAEHVPAIDVGDAQATYLAWLDCRQLNLGADPAAVFRTRGRVALASGLIYGPGGDGFARFNYATSPQLVVEAVRRIASAVELAA